MKPTLIALVAIVALLSVVSPAMALSQASCSFLSQVSQMIGGAIDGVVANNCGTSNTTSTPPGPSGGGAATVATTEPLVALGVGLGLLGARLLRRR